MNPYQYSTIFFRTKTQKVFPHWCETPAIAEAVQNEVSQRFNAKAEYLELMTGCQMLFGAKTADIIVSDTPICVASSTFDRLKRATHKALKRGLRQDLYYKVHDAVGEGEHIIYCLTNDSFQVLLQFILGYVTPVERQAHWDSLLNPPTPDIIEI